MSKYVEKNRKTRGELARRYIQRIFNNPEDPMYTASDVTLAKQFNITRLTVINIRTEMGLKGRNARVVELLANIDTSKFTIKEISARINVKYQNVYKIIKQLNLKVYADKRPIESMLEYRRERSAGIR
jgi:hypothetical protein